MARDRSTFVALTMLTSTLRVALEPSRSNSPVCSTRSSLACPAADKLPISSRNSVPPAAASKRPTRILVEPVNAPASAPNSSASSSWSGSAPAFTLMKGRSFRREFAWTISASFSLPAPFGPVIRTGTSEAATVAARLTTFCIWALA